MLAEIVAMLEERALAGELDEATAVRDRIEPLTADHFVRWLPPSFRNAMALVDDVRAHRGLELDEGRKPEDPWARAVRDAGLPVPEPLGDRAVRERARRKQELVDRREDARALMEVRRLAASFGRVNPMRFNAAYRRLYPTPDREERRRRALVVTHGDRRIEATVRGPHGTEFTVSRPVGTDERVVVAQLLYRIEVVIPRSTGRTTARARADRTPKDTTATHEPRVDEDELAQEPEAHAAPMTGTGEPEATVDVMREIEQLVARLFAGAKREATDATPGSEGQEDADAVEEEHQAGEPVGAEERTFDDASVGPEPRDEPEGVVPVPGPDMSTSAHAPAEHPPPLSDVVEPHPAALELAERGAKQSSPDTSPPLPTQTSSEAPPSTAEGRPPPTAEHQPPPQRPIPRRPPTRRAAIAHRATLCTARRGCQPGLGSFRHAQAPPHSRRQADGEAPRGRSPPSPRGYARTAPRNRGPPSRPRH